MHSQDFTEISKRYMETSVIQSSAADILLALLDLKNGEFVLDAGCGTGNLTKKIYDITGAPVKGIDPSQGMIDESVKNCGNEIDFQLCSAEEISYKNSFDAIFCNSAFQWISDADKAIKNFHRALKPGGRIGIQAPGGKEYCTNFIRAINTVSETEPAATVFKYFKSPWRFLDTAQEYAELFMKHKFIVAFSEIQRIESFHTPDDVYKIFASGAIAGYLNKNYYSCKIDNSYIRKFQDIVREDFHRQAGKNGMVQLIFNRIYLVAVKN